MPDNRQLLSTHVHSKELSLLVDGIANGPRARKSKLKRLKLEIREIEIRALIDQNGKYYYSIPIGCPRARISKTRIFPINSPCSLNKPN